MWAKIQKGSKAKKKVPDAKSLIRLETGGNPQKGKKIQATKQTKSRQKPKTEEQTSHTQEVMQHTVGQV